MTTLSKDQKAELNRLEYQIVTHELEIMNFKNLIKKARENLKDALITYEATRDLYHSGQTTIPGGKDAKETPK